MIDEEPLMVADEEDEENRRKKPSLFERFKQKILPPTYDDEPELDPKVAMRDPHTGEIVFRRPEAVETISLMLRAPEGYVFSLSDILNLAMEEELQMNEDGQLYQSVGTHFGEEVVYSIAPLITSGDFKEKILETHGVPGLIFFAYLPSPSREVECGTALLQSAVLFGSRIGGLLLHNNEEPATAESLRQLHEEWAELNEKVWNERIEELDL